MIAMLCLTFNSTSMAQDKKYKEVIIQKQSEIINVSADSLWNIIKEFDNIGVFFSGIDHAEGFGEPEFEGATCSERTCHVNLKGYSEVREKLTVFNPEKRELAYEFAGGGPSFLLYAGNHWQIEKVSENQCILKMNATMRLKPFAGFLFGGKLKKTIEKELPISLAELKLYAETSEVSEAKKKRQEELKKKNAA